MGVSFINPFFLGKTASATFVNTYNSTVNQSSYTFSSIPVVPGLVVVVVHYEASFETLNSITIDGISATTVVTSPTTHLSRVNFFSATTSTNGNISVSITFSATLQRCGIAVWQIFDQNSSTAAATASTSAASGSSLSVTLNDLSNAVVIAGSTYGTGGYPNTWTGVSENYDQALETSGSQISGGTSGSGKSGSLTVEASFSQTTDTAGLAVAAWS
jgi:hypothetical protein